LGEVVVCVPRYRGRKGRTIMMGEMLVGSRGLGIPGEGEGTRPVVSAMPPGGLVLRTGSAGGGGGSSRIPPADARPPPPFTPWLFTPAPFTSALFTPCGRPVARPPAARCARGGDWPSSSSPAGTAEGALPCPPAGIPLSAAGAPCGAGRWVAAASPRYWSGVAPPPRYRGGEVSSVRRKETPHHSGSQRPRVVKDTPGGVRMEGKSGLREGRRRRTTRVASGRGG
jgi:hypothetical protein